MESARCTSTRFLRTLVCLLKILNCLSLGVLSYSLILFINKIVIVVGLVYCVEKSIFVITETFLIVDNHCGKTPPFYGTYPQFNN